MDREIKHYIDGNRVIIYELGYFYTNVISERIRILIKPEEMQEILWNKIRSADDLGGDSFENLCTHMNYIQIDRDPDFGVIHRVVISDKDKSSFDSYTRDYYKSSSRSQDLRVVESKIEQLLNDVFSKMGELNPTKVIRNPKTKFINDTIDKFNA